MSNKYENCFTDMYQNLYIRMFDTETKQSTIQKYNTNDVIPDLYVEDNNGVFISHADNSIKLSKKTFNTHKSMSGFKKEYEKQKIPIYGYTNKPHHFIRENFPNTIEHNHSMRTWFLDIEVRKNDNGGYSTPVDATAEISLIQVYDSFSKKYFILGLEDWDVTEYFNPEIHNSIKYKKFNSERDMLENFISIVEKLNPTIISGWSVLGYDIPYLTNRIENLNMNSERLSPVGLIKKESKKNDILGNYYQDIQWLGRMILDYQVLVKFGYTKYPDAKLDTCLQMNLNMGKVDHGFDDLDHLYLGNFNKYTPNENSTDKIILQLNKLHTELINGDLTNKEEFERLSYSLFVNYGIRDIEGLVHLDEKLQYIETTKSIAYICGVSPNEVLATLPHWKAYMFTQMLKDNQVLPTKQMYGNDEVVYAGGWVTSKPGKYHNVVSADFSSLYPSNTRCVNIGLETLLKENEIPEDILILKDKLVNYYTLDNPDCLEQNDSLSEMLYFKKLVNYKDKINPLLKKHNITLSPNGNFFRKDIQSGYAKLLGKIYADRKVEQKKIAMSIDEIERRKS